MSRKDNGWDNAVMESFFAPLKHELLAKQSFVSHQDARRAISHYIEMWFDRACPDLMDA